MAAVSDLRSAFVLMVCGAGQETPVQLAGKLAVKPLCTSVNQSLLGLGLKASSSSLINVELWAAGGL